LDVIVANDVAGKPASWDAVKVAQLWAEANVKQTEKTMKTKAMLCFEGILTCDCTPNWVRVLLIVCVVKGIREWENKSTTNRLEFGSNCAVQSD
jgi:hypothetical protein